MASLQIKRGTRSQLDTAATASELKVGELYLITDEDRLAIGTAINTYQDVGKATDYATAAQGTLADTALQSSALNNTALTGIPTAPTAAEGTNTTQIATTAFVLANSGDGGSQSTSILTILTWGS